MATQKATWGGFELLDRHSVLINEGGTPDELEPELAAFLQASIFGLPAHIRHPGTHQASPNQGLREFLNAVLLGNGVTSLEDLGGESLTTVLEGILSG